MILNSIPKMTHPLGKGWSQPSRKDIVFDGDTAYMNEATLSALSNYQFSDPTGVYEGKMWRRGRTLCWFSPGKTENTCKMNTMPIVLWGEKT